MAPRTSHEYALLLERGPGGRQRRRHPDAVKYNYYLWQNTNPSGDHYSVGNETQPPAVPTVAGMTAIQFQPPNVLTTQTVYYWRVDSIAPSLLVTRGRASDLHYGPGRRPAEPGHRHDSAQRCVGRVHADPVQLDDRLRRRQLQRLDLAEHQHGANGPDAAAAVPGQHVSCNHHDLYSCNGADGGRVVSLARLTP